MEKQKKTALIYALLAILSWSTASTAFKFSLFELTYYQVLYVSSLVATLMYFVFLVIENKLKEAFQFQKKDYLFTFLSALLNPIAYYLILLKAYSLLPTQSDSVLFDFAQSIFTFTSTNCATDELHLAPNFGANFISFSETKTSVN